MNSERAVSIIAVFATTKSDICVFVLERIEFTTSGATAAKASLGVNWRTVIQTVSWSESTP